MESLEIEIEPMTSSMPSTDLLFQQKAKFRRLTKLGKSNRFPLRSGFLGEAEPPPSDILPGAQLITYVLINAERLEAHCLVQSHTRLIG
jgi:hypothetical protein